MIDLFNKIWAGPISVKVSLIFVLFVLFMIFMTAPLMIAFCLAVIYAVYRIVKWCEYGE